MHIPFVSFVLLILSSESHLRVEGYTGLADKSRSMEGVRVEVEGLFLEEKMATGDRLGSG